MSRRSLHSALRIPHSALLLFCFATTAFAQAPSPHIVADPPLTPAEQLTKFHLPPGFEIQLVAAEPDIHKPINLAFDAAGRLYATGSIEYPFAASDPTKARDRVQRFTIGADGKATKVETVVTGLNIPIGIAPVNDELFVYSIPQVLRCRDTDGDGVFDEKRPVVEGFGFKDTHGMVNNITPWIDGWIYTCHGFSNESHATGVDGSNITMQSGNTFRWRADGSHVEYFTHGQVNPFGLAFDSFGNVFSSDCHTLPAYQLLRGAWYPSFGKPHDGIGFGPPMMKHQHGSTGIAGIVYYAATQFPPEYRDTLFIGNPITAQINHDRLKWHGSTSEAIEQPDFLSCDDRWFRPVDVKLGPDGALYIADFYNCIIGHYEVPLDHPQRDRHRGRIWRVVYKGDNTQKVPPPIDLTKLDRRKLVDRLADENLAVRMLASQVLHGRMDEETRKLLQTMADFSPNDDQRVAALWLVERQGGAIADQLHFIEQAPSLVKVHALKALAERQSTQIDDGVRAKIRTKLSDANPFIRRAAADCLGRHPARENLVPLLQAWQACPAEDTHLVHVIRLAIREQLRLPGIYAEITTLVTTPADLNRLVDVSLGLPTPAAAEFVQSRLNAGSVPNDVLGASIEHVARHLSTDKLSSALEQFRRYEQAPLEQQVIVTRALSKAIPARGEKLSPQLIAWQIQVARQLLGSATEAQVQAGIEFARDLKLAALYADLERLIINDIKFGNLRSPAIDACVASDAPRAIKLCEALLAATAEPLSIRQKAAQALGTLPQDAARTVLGEQLKSAPERLAVEIASALGHNPAGAELLLTAVQAGKASGWLLQDPAVTRSLNRAKLPQLTERLAKLTAGLPVRDDRLTRLVYERRTGFSTHTPSAEQGKLAFKKICANCHRLGGEGQKIGPELDGIGLRGLDRLLEDVLDPSRAVDQAFRATIIATKDGRSLVGLAQRREGEVQILIDAAGKEQRIAISDIDEQIIVPQSPMPANVADLLKEPEFYDLVAYLLEQRQKPKQP
ncbi:MAG: c-type cytochrome [Planctomycetaceae bacterium]|nr:c-type cytochrome [Planctomycetaceae bacterium]